ncbi:hypothetical protein GYH30_056643 [Glycine max]|nr:hypothetical protein GYH30_056643 [Glycine max]
MYEFIRFLVVKFPFDLNAKPDDEEEASAKVGGGSETKLSVSETADNIGPDNDLEVTPDNDVHPTHAADSGYDEDRASIVEGGSGTGNSRKRKRSFLEEYEKGTGKSFKMGEQQWQCDLRAKKRR